ncbi:copper resistance protein B [Oscillatoria sp. CS-180]|uniref:copper resistance protein B n=1 Tax=Oscillatoria sp. CS-180 TaxID=3021720 RepID=UPI00232D04F1|nr:copper resistance protein B [Oscillatoria sp. CS-180]MDB9529710.1 copper resistance protein B [Oscillatoria sp. CS-180]
MRNIFQRKLFLVLATSIGLAGVVGLSPQIVKAQSANDSAMNHDMGSPAVSEEPGASTAAAVPHDMSGTSDDALMPHDMSGMSGDAPMDHDMSSPAVSEEPGTSAVATVPHDMSSSAAQLLEADNASQQPPSLGQSNVSEVNRDEWPEPVEDSQIFSYFLIDQLEYRLNEGEDTLNLNGIGWIGGDYQRLWIKAEGDIGINSGDGEAELQLLYGRLIAPFWDFQAGIRYDQVYSSEGGPGRAFGVLGIQGLAPYQFEVEGALFVSQEGDVSARFAAEYPLLLTQRLVLQPEFETNIAIQRVEEFGVGSGLNDIELGLRLRYEVNRRFAPYVGINWTQKFGETADFAREEEEEVSNFAVLGGFRLLF